MFEIGFTHKSSISRWTLQLEVYVTGTVKLECMDKEGVPVILQLYNTLYIPQAKVCLFSLQKTASGTL